MTASSRLDERFELLMSFRSRHFEYLGYRSLIARYMQEDAGMRHEAAPRPRLADSSFRTGYLDDSISIERRRKWVAEREFVTTEDEPLFDAADIVRCGKHLIVQHGFTTNRKGIDWLRRHFPSHRVHALNFPGRRLPCAHRLYVSSNSSPGWYYAILRGLLSKSRLHFLFETAGKSYWRHNPLTRIRHR